MSSIADLRPGDIGFGPIRGGAGLLVNAGQLALGEGFRVGTLDVRHVFVVVRGGDEPGWPQVVEAMPSGARLKSIAEERLLMDVDNRWTSDYAYVRLSEDYPGQAGDAAAVARAMIGTPYSFASYAALALWRLEALIQRKTVGSTTWRGEGKPGMGSRLEAWINRRKPGFEAWNLDGWKGPSAWLELPCEAICSVLADQAWSLTGKKVMQGVAHQCVTPGALAGRLLTMSGTQWFWPGRNS